jgi:hypothetical protein
MPEDGRIGGFFNPELKHPNSNIQAPEKIQTPSLQNGASLDVGAWNLDVYNTR